MAGLWIHLLLLRSIRKACLQGHMKKRKDYSNPELFVHISMLVLLNDLKNTCSLSYLWVIFMLVSVWFETWISCHAINSLSCTFLPQRTFWARLSVPSEKSSAPQEGGWRRLSRKSPDTLTSCLLYQ